MKRRLEWEPEARADLLALGRRDQRQAERIRLAMHRYASESIGDVVKLTDRAGLYRLRVGDWRVLFAFEDGGLIVLALRVLNRRDAYR